MKAKERKSRSIDDMFRCPACGAFNYGYKKDGANLTAEEKIGVYCRSCHIDVIPILVKISNKMKELEAEEKAKAKEIVDKQIPVEEVKVEVIKEEKNEEA
jgi:hypothetical protein